MEEQINKLIQEEVKRSVEKHGHMASDHEGYAVLLEELEELGSEHSDFVENLKILWSFIKSDTSHSIQKPLLMSLREISIHMVEEAIQVAAMVEKFDQDGQRRSIKISGANGNLRHVAFAYTEEHRGKPQGMIVRNTTNGKFGRTYDSDEAKHERVPVYYTLIAGNPLGDPDARFSVQGILESPDHLEAIAIIH